MTLDNRHHEFIEWLLTPPPHRAVRTQTALAEKLGVSKQTLTTWRADPTFKRELERRQKAIVQDPSKLTALSETIYQAATGQGECPHCGGEIRTLADIKAAELWLKTTGALKGSMEVHHTTDFGSLSNAELLAFLDEAAADEAARRAGA